MKENKRSVKIILSLSLSLAAGCGKIGGYAPIDEQTQSCEAGVGGTYYGQSLCVFKLFGQRYITNAGSNEIVPNAGFHIAGVAIDTHVKPNKVYVADTTNSRILGFSSLGTCNQASATECTNNSDCPSGDSCVINPTRNADLFFGQPDGYSGGCNLDDNFGFLSSTKAGSGTLCLMPFPLTTNLAESWSRLTIATDSEGNLYVPDNQNNRILKYIQPFSSSKANGAGDTVADFVWGQDDFVSHEVNRGQGNVTDQKSLSLAQVEGEISAGVSVDSSGNVWVADPGNGRVLRFPKNSKSADLVLGQADFTSASNDCKDNADLGHMCRPLHAKVDPSSGYLYVLDNYDAGNSFIRVLEFIPPFSSSMQAARQFKATQSGGIGFSRGQPQAVYFRPYAIEFNPVQSGSYAGGKFWFPEHVNNRVILTDINGNSMAVVGAKDLNQFGCDDAWIEHECEQKGSGDSSSNYNCWAGPVAFDDQNNMYVPDAIRSRVSIHKLPETNITVNGNSCPQPPLGSILRSGELNRRSLAGIASASGFYQYKGQLGVLDSSDHVLVWNDYLHKSNGSAADFSLTQTTDTPRAPNSLWLNDSIDSQGRLWTLIAGDWYPVAFQLPLTATSTVIKDYMAFYWADDLSKVATSTYNQIVANGSYLWIPDSGRIFRAQIPSDLSSGKILVDMVLGQPDKTSVTCNREDSGDYGLHPKANSLCLPLFLKFDRYGNLFVVDNAWEGHGDQRVIMYEKADLETATGMFPMIAAKKVFRAPDLTTRGPNDSASYNYPNTPISVAFSRNNEMIMAADGYYAGGAYAKYRAFRQLWYWKDPLKKDSAGNYIQDQKPDGYINLPLGSGGEMAFDDAGNLIIADHTWERIITINLETDRSTWLVLNPTPDPSPTPDPIFLFKKNLKSF